jgi:hypothetical protein
MERFSMDNWKPFFLYRCFFRDTQLSIYLEAIEQARKITGFHTANSGRTDDWSKDAM